MSESSMQERLGRLGIRLEGIVGIFFSFINSFVNEHGRRRQLGLWTLVVACAFMAGWVRSLTSPLHFNSPEVLGQIHAFGSHSGAFFWIRLNRCEPSTPASAPTPEPERRSLARDLGFSEIEIRQNSGGLAMFAGKGLAIPYWVVTVPLTLISIWLLLSKPHNSDQKINDALPTNEVA